MELSNITYQGPPYLEDSELISLLPENLVSLLKQINGFIQFNGGLHVRGMCKEPEWHSLKFALKGEFSIYKLFSNVKETDIPFAQDCMADQYILRNGLISKLHSETGAIEELHFGLGVFFENVTKNPQEFLGLTPLMQLRNEGKYLEPGQVINAYPPFCTKEAANGVSLSPINALEAHRFLSDFAAQTNALEDGNSFRVRIE